MNVRMSLSPKKYFYNLLFTISTFFVAVIFLLSLFLYFNFKSFGIDIVNRSSQKLLSQIGYNVSFINEYVKTNSAALFGNPNVAQLMYDDNIEIYDTLRNINAISSMVKSTPFVHSVYAYNGSLKRFYAVGAENVILDSGNFYDQEIIGLLNDQGGQPSSSPIARRLHAPASNPAGFVDVYTYIINETRPDRTVKNSLVLNVNISWIFNTLITTQQSDDGNNIMLLDAAGNVMGHSKSELFLSDLAKEPYVQTMMQRHDKTGYFVDNVNGRKSVVVFSSIDHPEWKIVNIIPYRNIAQAIDKVKRITLTISLLIFVAGLCLCYALSRMLYSPVRILRKRIEHLLGKSGTAIELANEFQYIESNVSVAVDGLLSLKKFKNSNLGVLKKALLQSMLAGKTPVEERLKELNVQINPQGSLTVILLKIDNFQEFRLNRSEEEKALFRFALTNISTEIFAQRFPCESLDSGGDHTISIISAERAKDDDAGTLLAELSGLLQNIRDVYASYFKFTVSSFISEPCDDLTGIHERYNQAQKIALNRLRYGHSCLVSYQDVAVEQLAKFDVSDRDIADLLEALKGGKKDQMESRFTSIVDKLYRCDHNSIMFTLSHVASSLFSALNTIEQNSTVKFEIDFISFHDIITKLETLEQIQTAFFELFTYIVAKINSSKDKENRHNVMIESAILYIQTRYMDKNLSQNAIADKLKISPVTLGKMFREITGETLVDYIKDIRLNKAKDYLKETNYSIDEIIDEIGWGNKKYFSTVFKQTFGVTPMEYRLKSSIAPE